MTKNLPEGEYRRLKGNLTRAINSGSHVRVIRACEKAFRSFEQYSYPDDWHRWQRANDDAAYALQREAANRR